MGLQERDFDLIPETLLLEPAQQVKCAERQASPVIAIAEWGFGAKALLSNPIDVASEGLLEKGLVESGLLAAPLGTDRDPQQPGNIGLATEHGTNIEFLNAVAVA